MTKQEAAKIILERTGEYCLKAYQIYGVRIEPTVLFDLKGRTMGIANHRDCVLRFNLTALNVDGGWKHLLEETVPHEVAHLVQYAIGPKDRKTNPPHGKIWKGVMRQFGHKPEVYHSIDLPPARVRRTFEYLCGCKTHTISSVIHNRIKKGNSYRCRDCREVIMENS